MTWDDDNYLQALRADVADARSLMSNPRKPERDRMAVRALLRYLGVAFEDAAAWKNPSMSHFARLVFELGTSSAAASATKNWRSERGVIGRLKRFRT